MNSGIPPIKTYRNVDKSLSLVQDANKQFAHNTSAAINSIQSATGQGTIASGVLCSVNFPPTGSYVLVKHGLGYVATGFLMVNVYQVPVTLARDPADPVPSYPAPSQTPTNVSGIDPKTTSQSSNTDPTNYIRLQQSGTHARQIQVWIF